MGAVITTNNYRENELIFACWKTKQTTFLQIDLPSFCSQFRLYVTLFPVDTLPPFPWRLSIPFVLKGRPGLDVTLERGEGGAQHPLLWFQDGRLFLLLLPAWKGSVNLKLIRIYYADNRITGTQSKYKPFILPVVIKYLTLHSLAASAKS